MNDSFGSLCLIYITQREYGLVRDTMNVPFAQVGLVGCLKGVHLVIMTL